MNNNELSNEYEVKRFERARLPRPDSLIDAGGSIYSHQHHSVLYTIAISGFYTLCARSGFSALCAISGFYTRLFGALLFGM